MITRLTHSALVLFAFGAPLCSGMQMFDDPLFFRVNHFFGEPRLEKPLLSSLDASVMSGSTHTSRNGCGEKVPLLNIYGPQNMIFLGSNVPNKNPSNPADLALIMLGNQPSRDCFADLLFTGRFNAVDLNIVATQNIVHGFFLQAHIPFRKIELNCIAQCDLSPRDAECPNINNPIWQAFLNSFDAILSNYHLSLGSYEKSGLGDITGYLGWARNYQDTEVLDYVDLSFKFGVLFPTGKKKNINNVFDIPLGYNGHLGATVVADVGIGAYEWLTAGAHFRVIGFRPKCQTLRMKTDPRQNGFIKLAIGTATVDEGAVFEAGAYLKADHIVRGFSCFVGYSYTQQHSDVLKCPSACFACTIINTDPEFKQWSMHSLNFGLEYDFTGEDACVGPRLSAFYDRQVGGRRVFDTSMGGVGIGVDIAW